MGARKGSSTDNRRVQIESLENRRLLSAGQMFFNGLETKDTPGPIFEQSTSGANAQVLGNTDDGTEGAGLLLTDGTNLYAIETGAVPGSIHEYSTSGQLLNDAVVTGLNSPSGAAMSATDFFITNTTYNANTSLAGYISEYSTSGALVHTRLISGLGYDFSVAVDGSHLLVLKNLGSSVSRTSSILEYDSSTGALENSAFITPTASSGGGYSQLVVSGSSIFAASNAGTIDQFDAASGTLIKEDLVTLPNFTSGPPPSDSLTMAADNNELFILAYPNAQGSELVYQYSITGTLEAELNIGISSYYVPTSLVVLNTTGAPLTSQLQFTASPTSTQQGEPLGTVSVQVQSPAGQVVSGDDSTVTLSLSGGTAGASLSGTTTVQAVDGLATFSGLSINQPGNGYTITASTGAFTGATSAPFDIIPSSVLSPAFGKIKLPASAVVATPLGARLPVILSNTGSLVHGKATVNLFANTSPTLDGNQILLKSVEKKNLVLKAGHKAVIGVSIPSLSADFAPGTYYLIAQVVDPLNRTASVATVQTISVADPNVAGTVAMMATQGPFAKGTLNSIITFTVTVTNSGNVPLRGQELSITSSYINGAHPVPVAGVLGLKHAFGRPLAVNATRTFKLRYRGTKTTPSGLYALQADVSVADSSAVIQGGTGLDLTGQGG